MREPTEVVVLLRRDGEYLVLRRSPERFGYWNPVAGGVEPGETPADAARRELREETGLDAAVEEVPVALSYSLLEDPPEVRARFAPGTDTVTVHAFVAEAPPGWEPTLDSEHDRSRWCSVDEALSLFAYETPREALRAVAGAGG